MPLSEHAFLLSRAKVAWLLMAALTGFVQVCADTDAMSCVWVSVSELLQTADPLGAFDLPSFEIGVGAVLTFFGIGFGVGLFISTLRKLRI
jgi:hypothetical protein